MKQEQLFPTPLWSSTHPSPEFMAALAQHLLRLEANDPKGIQRTNQGGWHSQDTLLTDSFCQDLFHWIAAQARPALEAWGWDMASAWPWFTSAWGMINRQGDSTRAHLHPNSIFSGVIYLQAHPESGRIAFLDPRAGAQMLQAPLSPEALQREGGRILRRPEPGLLLLFPAWLWHEVEPNACQQPRISISFNLGLKLRSSDG